MEGLLNLLLWVPGLLLALTFHEFSHGMVAYKLGDPTPERAGRLTLNPLAHLDVMGTIALFLFHFGWAKPVPINPHFLRNPKRDMIFIAIAGPAANFILAIIAGIIVKILSTIGQSGTILWYMMVYTMDINVILMAFNLIPIPPLDGSKILFGLTNINPRTIYNLERMGPMILLGIIILGSMSGFNILFIFISPAIMIFHQIFI